MCIITHICIFNVYIYIYKCIFKHTHIYIYECIITYCSYILFILLIIVVNNNNKGEWYVIEVYMNLYISIYQSVFTRSYLSSSHLSFHILRVHSCLSLSQSSWYHCWSPDAVCLLRLPQTHTHTKHSNNKG